MRSAKSTEAYEQHVAGMLKDIAFHELLMERHRIDNAKDEMFDADFAFDIIDKKKTGTVSAFELQGFLDLNGYKFGEQVCQQIVSAIDKNTIHMKRHTLVNMLMPEDKQLRINSLRRHDRIEISVLDFDYWRRVRAATEHRMLNYLFKQATFYREFLERKKNFCHIFYADIYTLMNYFGHTEKVNQEMVYGFLKSCKVILNGDEYKAIVRRSVHRDPNDQTAKIVQITKQQLADLLLTNKLNLKQTFIRKQQQSKPSYYDFKRPDQTNASKNITIPPTDPYHSALMMQPPKRLKYKYHYPQAQINSLGNLHLLNQQFSQLGLHRGGFW